MGDFEAWFRTDGDCLDYLEWLRWPKGFVCPSCDHSGAWRLRDGRFMCPECGYRTSTTAGTNLRPNAHTVDGVVHCLLALCHSQGRNLSAQPEAHPGDR